MNEAIKVIDSLRSVREFSEKQISCEDLNTIIDSSLRAANASARQSYSQIVIRDKGVMKELTGYVGNTMIVYCIDFNRIIKTAEYLKEPCSKLHIIDFLTGSIDTILVAQTAVISAKSLGIDSLITNGIFRGNLEKAYKILNLPEECCFPLISVVFGYSTKEPNKRKGRLNNETIIHYEKYNELTAEKIRGNIEEYNNHEKNLGLTDNWEELGYENYLNWFYSKWMGGFKSDVTSENGINHGIKIFYDILRKAGFLDNKYNSA